MSALLVLTVWSIIVLLFCLILHYSQHFKIQKCSNIQNTPNNRSSCCFSIWISLEAELNLFPQFFIFYVLFLLLLCILVSIKMFLITTHFVDWLLIYGLLAICCMESFFSFYQYIIIMDSAPHLVYMFVVFCAVFASVFAIQIHYFYYIWPLLVIAHLTFNVFCILRFSSYLLGKYSTFNYSILPSIYLMRTLMIVCCVLQCIYFTLFLGLYDIDLIYHYLPLFWSISCFIFTMNFIKNRYFLQHNIFKMYQYLKHNTIATYIQNKQAQRILDQQAFINNHNREYRLSIEARERLEKAMEIQLQQEQINGNESNDANTNNTAIACTQNHEIVEETKTQPIVEDTDIAHVTAVTPPPVAAETRKRMPRRPSLVSRSRSLNSIIDAIGYKEEQKEIGPNASVYPQGRYKAMDILGLTQTKTPSHTPQTPQTPISPIINISAQHQSPYVTMNEEEKLDICDIGELESDAKDANESVKSPSFSIKSLMFSRFSVQKKRNSAIPFLIRAKSSPVIVDDVNEIKKAKQLRRSMNAMNAMKKTNTTDIIIKKAQHLITIMDDETNKNDIDRETNHMSDEDGFVFYEEQNEEEGVDIAYDDVELDNNEVMSSNHEDDSDIVDVINKNKLDLPQLEDAVNSMHSLIGLGLVHQKSLSSLRQLTLYQQQNSNIFE